MMNVTQTLPRFGFINLYTDPIKIHRGELAQFTFDQEPGVLKVDSQNVLSYCAYTAQLEERVRTQRNTIAVALNGIPETYGIHPIQADGNRVMQPVIDCLAHKLADLAVIDLRSHLKDIQASANTKAKKLLESYLAALKNNQNPLKKLN